MNNEELLENTEILEEEISTETEAIVMVDTDQTIQVLETIAFDVRVILLFMILTFCGACLRSWRNNTIKGAK